MTIDMIDLTHVFQNALVEQVTLEKEIPEAITLSGANTGPAVIPKEVVAVTEVPREVLDYLETHGGQFLHGEHVWSFEQPQSRRTYAREFNYGPKVRKLLEEDAPLGRYLKELKAKEGTEVPTAELSPDWEQPKLFHDAFKIPGEDGSLVLLFSEDGTDYNKFVKRLVIGNYSGPPVIHNLFIAGRITMVGRAKY